MAPSSRKAANLEEICFPASALQEDTYKHQQLQAKQALVLQFLHARYRQAYQRHLEVLLNSQREIGLPRSAIKGHKISCLFLFLASNITGLSGKSCMGQHLSGAVRRHHSCPEPGRLCTAAPAVGECQYKHSIP